MYFNFSKFDVVHVWLFRDDASFLKVIQSSLSDEYAYISSRVSYGIGYSNGGEIWALVCLGFVRLRRCFGNLNLSVRQGFLVTQAAGLFRGISAISGHVYDIHPSLLGAGISLFMHHAVDDPYVKSTGCCDGASCCCGIDLTADTCTPAFDVIGNWALKVNNCQLAQVETKDDTIVGFVRSYHDIEIDCYTASGNCDANTTICIYANTGRLSDPVVRESVIQFFAVDACGINGGTWLDGACSCSNNRSGAFCIDSSFKNVSGRHATTADVSPAFGLWIGLVVFVTALWRRYKRTRKRNDRDD